MDKTAKKIDMANSLKSIDNFMEKQNAGNTGLRKRFF